MSNALEMIRTSSSGPFRARTSAISLWNLTKTISFHYFHIIQTIWRTSAANNKRHLNCHLPWCRLWAPTRYIQPSFRFNVSMSSKITHICQDHLLTYFFSSILVHEWRIPCSSAQEMPYMVIVHLQWSTWRHNMRRDPCSWSHRYMSEDMWWRYDQHRKCIWTACAWITEIQSARTNARPNWKQLVSVLPTELNHNETLFRVIHFSPRHIIKSWTPKQLEFLCLSCSFINICRLLNKWTHHFADEHGCTLPFSRSSTRAHGSVPSWWSRGPPSILRSLYGI